MKFLCFPAVTVLGVLLSLTAPLSAAPPEETNAPVNYVIKVLMKDAKGNSSSLQVTTIAGQFQLDTLQKNPAKVGNMEVPSTLKMTGTLAVISEQKGQLKLFLGRTVPYVTSTYNNGSPSGNSSTYSQLSVGLDSAFVVTFGNPLVIQVDDNGEVSVLVTQEGK
jgi:hypothetical protein